MRCISPFDNGSYHMGTVRTNRTNRQLGEGFLGLHRVRNILSPPNEIQFSIGQRVVPHGSCGRTCAVVGCLIIAPLLFGFCFTLATYLSTSFYLDTLLNVQASIKC